MTMLKKRKMEKLYERISLYPKFLSDIPKGKLEKLLNWLEPKIFDEQMYINDQLSNNDIIPGKIFFIENEYVTNDILIDRTVKKRIEDHLYNQDVITNSINDSVEETNAYCMIKWLKYPHIYQDIINLTDDIIKNHKRNDPKELVSGIMQVLFKRDCLLNWCTYTIRIEIAKYHFKTDIRGQRKNPYKGINKNEEIFNRFSKEIKSLMNAAALNSGIRSGNE